MHAPEVEQPKNPAKLKKRARNPDSYRAARRNAARVAYREAPLAKRRCVADYMVRIGDKPQETIAPSAELNRSQNWSRAKTYAYAREISPYPERPLR